MYSVKSIRSTTSAPIEEDTEGVIVTEGDTDGVVDGEGDIDGVFDEEVELDSDRVGVTLEEDEVVRDWDTTELEAEAEGTEREGVREDEGTEVREALTGEGERVLVGEVEAAAEGVELDDGAGVLEELAGIEGVGEDDGNNTPCVGNV